MLEGRRFGYIYCNQYNMFNILSTYYIMCMRKIMMQMASPPYDLSGCNHINLTIRFVHPSTSSATQDLWQFRLSHFLPKFLLNFNENYWKYVCIIWEILSTLKTVTLFLQAHNQRKKCVTLKFLTWNMSANVIANNIFKCTLTDVCGYIRYL